MLEVYFLIMSVTLLSYYFLRKLTKFFSLLSNIPSVKGQIPLLGIARQLAFADHKQYFKIICVDNEPEFNQSPVWTWFGPQIIVIINTPEHIKAVFNSKECLDKPYFIKVSDFTKGLIFGNLNYWHSHRKILNPVFTVRVLKNFVKIFNEQANKFVDVMEMKGAGREIDIFTETSALFYESIMVTSMNYDVDVVGNEVLKKEIMDNFVIDLEAASKRMMNIFLHPDFIYKNTKLHRDQQKARSVSSLRFVDKIVKEGKIYMSDSFIDNDIEIKNSIEALCNPRHNLTDDEIREEVNTIILAGQDTTAKVTAQTLIMLAMFKDIQKKVVDEINTVVPNKNDDIDFEAINKFIYLEKVIKETMRLFPITAVVLRTTIEDFQLDDSYKIPAGVNILIRLFNIQRDKRYWGEDADEFKPERFDKENIKNVHPYAFIPFTGGPRICLGWRYAMMFMKTTIANFLRHFEVDTTLRYDEIEFELDPVLRMVNAYNITIKKRG